LSRLGSRIESELLCSELDRLRETKLGLFEAILEAFREAFEFNLYCTEEQA
jgi:hypothetical protein